MITNTRTITQDTKNWFKKVGAGIRGGYHEAGKRQAPGSGPCLDSATTEQNNQLLEDLKTSCPSFGIDPDVGLTRKVAAAAFDESDGQCDVTHFWKDY